jgi:uncharacterized repeat protein (TIGR01451 family)
MDRSQTLTNRLPVLLAAFAVIFGLLAGPVLPALSPERAAAVGGTVTLEEGVAGCMGVRTTPGSENTTKELVGGTLEPGGTALFRFTFPATVQGNPGQEAWEITDCVFLNDEPFQKYKVTALENDISPVVIEFLLTIPSDVPVGAEFCNYGKTTQTPSDAQASNRKAGPACFIVGGALRIEKVDGSDNPLAGATFTVACDWPNVTDGTFLPDTILSVPTNGTINGGASSETINSTDDGSFSRTVVTGDQGVISVNGPVDTVCTFTETAAPPGYVVPAPPDNAVTLTIDDAGQQLHQFVNVLPPDLTISKTPDSGTVNAGDPISFVITVSNSADPGTGTAVNVVIDDTLPAGFTWTDNKAECDITSNVLHCDVGDLAPGASFSVTLTSPTDEEDCGLVSNPDATAEADNHDEVSDSGQQTVQCPDLTIEKLPDGDTIDAGDPISFSITVHNDGPGSATNVTIDDDLPDGFEWAEDPDQGECAIDASDHLHCDIASLASGADFTVNVTSPTQASDCETFLNTAVADADNHAQISNDGSVTIQCPGLNIAKIAADEEIVAGEPAEFEIVVWNTGPGTATNVTLHDELPGDNLVWSETDDPSDSCDVVNNVLDCDFGDLGVTTMENSTARVTVTAATDGDDCGDLDNTAFADADNSDQINAFASINVRCPTLVIDKAADVEVITKLIDAQGNVISITPDTVTWTLTYTLTNGPVTDAVITEPIPDGLTYIPDSEVPDADFDAGTNTLTWTFPLLEESGSVTFETSVDEDAPSGEILNVATIESNETDEDTGEDSVRIVEEFQGGGSGTPAQSLTNTAMSTSATGGLASLLFAFILMAALGGLAYVNVTAVRRRR